MKPTVTIELDQYNLMLDCKKAIESKKAFSFSVNWEGNPHRLYFPSQKQVESFKSDKIAQLELTIKQKEDNATQWYDKWCKANSTVNELLDERSNMWPCVNKEPAKTNPYSIILAVVISVLIGIGIGLIL